MVERTQITLIYQYNDNWIGGTYYILNIIKALNMLADEMKPQLNIITDKDSTTSIITAINYPYIKLYTFDKELNFFLDKLNRLYAKIFGDVFFKKALPYEGINNVYPVPEYLSTKNLRNYYYWIPDFQEHHLPHFFSEKEIRSRVVMQKAIVKANVPVIFSSKNALDDFNAFYPNNNNKKRVLNFVSILTDHYKTLNIKALLQKYNISKRYFIICNQFWKHKNHQVVLEAAKKLINKYDDFQIIFTGKEHDYRNPDHVNLLKQFVNQNALNNDVLFLGFIDRDEQLQLMKHAVCVIQPSLFEGWSTVVEDCKAINQLILVSDIPLHREQCTENKVFFDPYNVDDLSDKMVSLLNNPFVLTENDYAQTCYNFAKNILTLFP